MSLIFQKFSVNFKNILREARDLAEKLNEKKIDPEIIFYPTKVYIGVQMPNNWRKLASILFRQNQLIIEYSRAEPKDYNDPEKKLIYNPNSLKYFGQHISTQTINTNEDALYAAFLFKQSYTRFVEQFGK